MFENYKNEVIEYLKKESVSIHSSSYKKSEAFRRICHAHVVVKNFWPMPIEEYIERYLLTKEEVAASYKSIYDMGNSVELDKEDCKYNRLAKAIMKNIELDKDGKFHTMAIMKGLVRETGLIDRLNKYLHFDIKLFCKSNIKHQSEICKILYFFYTIENIDEDNNIKKRKILELLSKHSMENIDKYFMNEKTYNGDIVKKIKYSLAKELNLTVKQQIQNSLIKIQTEWNDILAKTYRRAAFLKSDLIEMYCPPIIDETINLWIDKMINSLQDAQIKLDLEENVKYMHSPIETLFLKVLQYEYLGYAKDLLFVNEIKNDFNSITSVDYIEEMRRLRVKKISVNDIAFKIDVHELARLVYLKQNPTKTERERIQDNIDKVVILSNYFKSSFNSQLNTVNELFVVSCLQAIILNKKKREIFDYTFHGYQEKASSRKPTVQGALFKDKRVYEALRYYWMRKVMDRWYSNCGMHEERGKLRELEKVCDNIQIQILMRPNIDEMLDIHNYYVTKALSGFDISLEQVKKMVEFKEFLAAKGFTYIDNNDMIRYIFIYSMNIDHTYNDLASFINFSLMLSKDDIVPCRFIFDDRHMEIEFELVFTQNTCFMKNFEISYDAQYIERLKRLGIDATQNILGLNATL